MMFIRLVLIDLSLHEILRFFSWSQTTYHNKFVLLPMWRKMLHKWVFSFMNLWKAK